MQGYRNSSQGASLSHKRGTGTLTCIIVNTRVMLVLQGTDRFMPIFSMASAMENVRDTLSFLLAEGFIQRSDDASSDYLWQLRCAFRTKAQLVYIPSRTTSYAALILEDATKQVITLLNETAQQTALEVLQEQLEEVEPMLVQAKTEAANLKATGKEEEALHLESKLEEATAKLKSLSVVEKIDFDELWGKLISSLEEPMLSLDDTIKQYESLMVNNADSPHLTLGETGLMSSWGDAIRCVVANQPINVQGFMDTITPVSQLLSKAYPIEQSPEWVDIDTLRARQG